MKRLFKPWVVALIAALGVHGVFFVSFKDRHWGIDSEVLPPANLNVSIIPAATEAPSEGIDPQNNEQSNGDDVSSTEETLEPETKPATSSVTPESFLRPELTSEQSERETTNMPNSQASSEAVTEGYSLSQVQAVTERLNQSQDSWKTGSLLDIGNNIASKTNFDPKKDAFSPAFRKALKEAKSVQAEYSRGIIEQEEYPITEDADGTRYVNIKGVCWKLPEPGSNAEWQIILSGCSGQKDVFRFELNITTDILRSDIFEGLPFSMPE